MEAHRPGPPTIPLIEGVGWWNCAVLVWRRLETATPAQSWAGLLVEGRPKRTAIGAPVTPPAWSIPFGMNQAGHGRR